jgi:hypothetical protein
VLIAALNPSPTELVRKVLDGLEARATDDPPFALILDTNVQRVPWGNKPSQLDTVLGGLSDAIGTGGLAVFLCRSYQNYATFGFGKAAAGDLTCSRSRTTSPPRPPTTRCCGRSSRSI